MAEPFALRPGSLTLADMRALMDGGPAVAMVPDCWAAVEAAAALVRGLAEGDERVYGINTGFGSLARTSIPAGDIRELQRRLVLSHCVGIGPPLPDPVVRLVMLLKANVLARGHSGVDRAMIDALLALLNGGVHPVIPGKGSVGASGDLAPLAHLAAALIGEGEVRYGGETLSAAAGLERIGLAPLTLGPKEGLAMLNGTQVSTALAAAGLFAIENVFAAALVAGALSVDATLGSDTPFDARIHEVRGQPGQAAVATTLRELLEGSGIRASHLTCSRVQDPYSLRCQPQVMGACLDLIGFAAGVIEREANAVTDNPLVFAESGEILSGGNFHAEPVAFAADTLALAIAEIGSLSERRVAMLTDASMSELPAFLVAEPGLNSGFMAVEIEAAALASENKSRAHPASVDSLPTVANQEDHVSMATFAARRLGDMVENAAAIVAIELLATAQGIDLRRPLKTSAPLARAHAAVRERSAFLEDDRPLKADIEAVAELVTSGWFRELAPIGPRG